MLPVLASIAIGITAVVHFGFMYVETCKWERLARDMVKLWPRVKDKEAEAAAQAATEAARPIGFNMGLYNGFFAVGLTVTFFGLLTKAQIFGTVTEAQTDALRVFILICVVVAGIVGAITLKTFKLLLAQSAPAVVALALIWNLPAPA